jgi:hypothetical protein
MARRRILGRLATWPLAAVLPGAALASTAKLPLKVMMKSAWGSDDPTKAAFPFSHGLALASLPLRALVDFVRRTRERSRDPA